jgi:NitT/TauT family transport system substrate-binding protein
MFRGLGIDPIKDVKWVAAPAGAPAGLALQKGDVDGYVSYDTHSARLTNLGFKYRVLPYTVPLELKGVAGFYVGARSEFIQANRELIAGFARTIAKGTVFALANTDAAARAFFKIAPEAVPKGKSQDEAVVEIVRMIQSRAKNWRRDEPHPWGQIVKEELQADARFLGVADKVDVSAVFTNEFIDAANKFDAAKIQEQAKGYKK